MESYNKPVSVICLVSSIMQHAIFGKDWKVVQTHAVMCCEVALELQHYLLVNECFQFVYMGRFLQDSIENEFSNIRIQRPKPSARDFKFRLKQLCVAGCYQKIDGASYDFNDSLNLICSFKKEQTENAEPSLMESNIKFPHFNDYKKISEEEEQILYKISGYVVYKLKTRIKCANCYSKLLHSGDVSPPRADSSLASEFTNQVLVKVSDEVYQLFKSVEVILQAIKYQLKNIKSSIQLQILNHINTALSHLNLSTCHDIRSLLLKKFIGMRLNQLSANLSITHLDQSLSSAFGSKSMGSSLLADNFTPRKIKSN